MPARQWKFTTILESTAIHAMETPMFAPGSKICRWPHEQVQGRANARGIAAGSLFSLTGYAREDQNREYLVVSATHQVESDIYASGSEADATPVYTCHFSALNSKQPFRPSRATPKPK